MIDWLSLNHFVAPFMLILGILEVLGMPEVMNRIIILKIQFLTYPKEKLSTITRQGWRLRITKQIGNRSFLVRQGRTKG